MTFAADAKAIRVRFDARWSALQPNVPIKFQNVGGSTTPDATAWVRLTVLTGDSRQESMGARSGGTYNNPGIAVVQIFTPVGEGDGEARSLADTVGRIFRGFSETSTGNILFGAPMLTNVGPDGRFFQMNVDVPFDSYGAASTST